MSPQIIETRICPNCGAEVKARDMLTEFLIHVAEVVWCPKCGTELPKGGDPISATP